MSEEADAITSEIEQFAEQLQQVKTDGSLKWAVVEDMAVERKEMALDWVDAQHKERNNRGLTIRYRMVSGRTFEKWYPMPEQWEQMESSLIMLLDYWQADPKNLKQIRDSEKEYEVPVRFVEGSPGVDFREVEEKLSYEVERA